MQQGVSRQTSHNNFLLCWSNDFVMYKLVCVITDGSVVPLERKLYGAMKENVVWVLKHNLFHFFVYINNLNTGQTPLRTSLYNGTTILIDFSLASS